MQTALLCLVVAITDGDTMKVRCGEPGHYEQVTIRMAEIDAPEKSQAFGQSSKELLSKLCFSEQATIKPTTQDRYGRTVARVECRGKDANAEMVKMGMAWAFTKYQTDAAFPGYEQQARVAHVGLWRDAAPVAPWDYRSAAKTRPTAAAVSGQLNGQVNQCKYLCVIVKPCLP